MAHFHQEEFGRKCCEPLSGKASAQLLRTPCTRPRVARAAVPPQAVAHTGQTAQALNSFPVPRQGPEESIGAGLAVTTEQTMRGGGRHSLNGIQLTNVDSRFNFPAHSRIHGAT